MAKRDYMIRTSQTIKPYQIKTIRLSLLIGIVAAYIHYGYIVNGNPKQISTLLVLIIFSVIPLLLIKRFVSKLPPSSRWRYILD
jgi:hypothetical protein